MSTQQDIRRLTAPDIRARKNGEPIVSLTSYHAHTARLMDAYIEQELIYGVETNVRTDDFH